MYNALTGSTQYVGNWPGVTVEKKEGEIKGTKDSLLVDLPGIYSLSPYSLEERVTRDYLSDDAPDAVINIVDSTSIERSLYLTSQLLEMGVPLVVALNMTDVMEKGGRRIDADIMAKELGCPVIKTTAADNIGLTEVIEAATEQVKNKGGKQHMMTFAPRMEEALSEIETLVTPYLVGHAPRWVAVSLFGRDPVIKEHLRIPNDVLFKVDKVIKECEIFFDDDSESITANERYAAIEKILKHACPKPHKMEESVSDKIDLFATNKFLGLPIFFCVMWLVYYISITTVGDYFIGWIEGAFTALENAIEAFLSSVGVAPWLISLINEGCLSGVAAVMTFVPQLMILYVCIAFLEDCGYMARVAFIMDRIFRQFGLSGKSFIPMLIGSGCSVPAIMGTRTIENEKDRRMTIILTPFIPCGAKLPVLVLFTSMFFQDRPWVGPSMYIVGIVMVIISGIILKRTWLFAGEPAPFVMELPAYRWPTVRSISLHTWERAKSFIRKAGTVIFVACGAIWLLQNFSWSFEAVSIDQSILASVGRLLAPFFVPLGFGNWQTAVAILSGFVAKEAVVAAFGIVYGIADVAEAAPGLVEALRTAFNPVSAYAFMVFIVLAPPCFAAIGAIRSEMKSSRWTLIALGWQLLCGYTLAFIIHTVGTVLL